MPSSAKLRLPLWPDATGSLLLQCRAGSPPARSKSKERTQAEPTAAQPWHISNLHSSTDASGHSGSLSFALDGLWRTLHWHRDANEQLWIQDRADSFVFERVTRFDSDSDGSGKGGLLKAPMSARVIAVFAEVGQRVAKDDPLVVLESMKMEMPMLAPFAGRVEKLNVAMGEQLNAGQVILEVVANDVASKEQSS